MNRFAFIFVPCLLFQALSRGEIVKTPVDYKQGDTTLKGWIVYDDAIKSARPGILIFPEWWGLTDYPKHRSEQLAQLGYVAFAADMYGEGKTTDNPKEAGQWTTAVKSDIPLMRARAQAAFDVLAKDSHVDPNQIGAIGYCFGGTVSLELARSGANLKAVVSFHGGLATPHPEDAKDIKAKVLVCTGADDAFVSAKEIAAFEAEMRSGNVDWQIISYGGAHHAFTNPDADRHHLPNIAYNANADRRSWAAMQGFFTELFGSTGH